MAKKSRRARRGKRKQRKPPPVVRTTRRAAPRREVTPTVEPTAPAAATVSKAVDFSQEYHYVYADLKRIAIIAAALLAVLVVLALVIR